MKSLISFGAAAAILAGFLRILAVFIPYQYQNAWLETLYAVIDIGLLFGLIAMYLTVGEQLGRLGLVCFIFALIGIASIVGPDALIFEIDFYMAGSALFIVGLAGFSICLAIRRLYYVPAMLWIASALFGVMAFVMGAPIALAGAGLLLGAGFLTAGYEMARHQQVTSRQASNI